MLYITRRLFLKPFLKSYTASQCQMSTNKDKHFLELVNVKSRSGDIDFQQLKKKCLLIYFSAGWCGSCKALTPKLKKFYEQTKQGLEVVWVSKDKSEQDQLEHYENLPGWLYIQGKEIKDFYHIYNIQTIPALKLVDSEGEVITEDARLKVEDEVSRYLNENLPRPEAPGHDEAYQWWAKNGVRFPNLALLAREFLEISLSSMASERCFNKASLLFANSLRFRLGKQTAANLLIIKAELADGISKNAAEKNEKEPEEIFNLLFEDV